jgi:hypothetical protein
MWKKKKVVDVDVFQLPVLRSFVMEKSEQMFFDNKTMQMR